jgi:ABC-type branched-subunit amino acid transport system substrate-binding protein
MPHDELAAWVIGPRQRRRIRGAGRPGRGQAGPGLERGGFDGSLYLSPWSQDQNLLAYAGKLAPRIFLPSSFNPDDVNPRYLVFKEKHKELYGEAPVMSGVFGYEIGRFLAQGIHRARSPAPERVKAAILAIGSFDGLQYGFSLDGMGDSSMEALVITIKNGALRPG